MRYFSMVRNSILRGYSLFTNMVTYRSSLLINKDDVYDHMLQKQPLFDASYPNFEQAVSDYAWTWTDEKVSSDVINSPFTSNNERGGPFILRPYLFTIDPEEVLVVVLTKGYMLDSSRVNTTRYIRARIINGKWSFKKVAGSTRIHILKPSQEDVNIYSAPWYIEVIINDFIQRGYYSRRKLVLNRNYFNAPKI